MKSFRFNRAIFSAGAIALGIVLLIWPAGSLLIIAKCVGIILAVGGIAAGVMYYRDHESAVKSFLLVLALVMLICGVVIFLHPEELVKLFPTIVGILVMISGLINLGETFVLSRSKYGKWWISLIIAVITIALGVFIINKAFSLAALITRIAGGVLIFDGASHLWVISRISKASKEFESTVDGSAVEVGPKVPENGAASGPAAGGGPGSPAGAASAGANNGAAGVQAAAGAESGVQTPVNSATAGAQNDADSAAGELKPADSAAATGEAAGVEPASDNEGTSASVDVTDTDGQAVSGSEDNIPEYMVQSEQETDFLQYSAQNPVKTDKSESEDGEHGE